MLKSKNHSRPNDTYVQNLTLSFVIIVIFLLQRTSTAQMLYKIISQSDTFLDYLRNFLIIWYLQSQNFKLRKLGLCLLQTPTLQYLNSHFTASKLRLFKHP